MKRIISGAKPTGDLHIGNYFGTMKTWPTYQDEGQTFYFVADLHALNIRQDPSVLRKQSLDIAAWLITMGVDPNKSVLFVESQVPQHAELFAILNNYVTMGELSRMTQFKDKSQKLGPEGQVVGLFEYPVLMAADILLYDIDVVPVGDDQVQHVEIARDIAERFNNLYGKVFTLPKYRIQETGARIMDLQDPQRKMSKSELNSYILLVDPPDVIREKIKRAVTDSGSEIKTGKDKPALTNLLGIYALVAGKSVGELEKQYQGKGYGEFKDDLAEALIAELKPLQEKFQTLRGNEPELTKILDEGRQKAAAIAEEKVAEVKKTLGLI